MDRDNRGLWIGMGLLCILQSLHLSISQNRPMPEISSIDAVNES